ncbi:MAG: Na/Pi cotransporter family protein [Treponema sp.]|nr:Na/Pi cotransporter family protein [Treponema sp.]
MAIVNAMLLLFGSLGFLLYGMRLMSDGVQKSAGEKLQRALSMMTGNSFVGILTGLFITMIIQSSGATTVMVVSFINAGLLTLAQSVGVIFGANIGTTITAWIVSLFGFNFKISTFAVPIFGIGFFMTILKDSRSKNIGEAVMGFGLLFMGLSGLSDVFSFDASKLTFISEVQSLGILSLLIGVVIGTVITALMHSSSAFTAIIITMAYKNIITWEMACAMTLGSNIGSTIDAIMAAFGTNADARRSAVIHVLFNVIGTVLALIFFTPFISFVVWLTPSSNIAIQISMLHTVFKTLNTVILLPLSKHLIALSKMIIKDDDEKNLKTYHLEFTDSAFVKESAAMHIIRLEKEIADMTDVATNMFDRLQIGIMKRNQDFIAEHLERLADEEDYCDQMHEKLAKYIINCQHLPITEVQRNNLSIMVSVVDELEGMTDQVYCAGMLLEKSIEKKMKIVQEDMERLVPYVELARQFLQFIRININKHLNSDKLEMAQELEDQIDYYRKNLKKIARKRLESGADVKAELLYIDLVRQIEKIGDHAFSISELLAQTK